MGGRSRRKQSRAMEQQNVLAQEQFEYYKKEQAQQKIAVEEQREQFEEFEFSNPFSGIKNPYENMDNVYEDMTVDMRAADFQAEQGAQQRADILGGLRGAAGTSGIAGLAQSMAQQGQLQSQQISAGIAQQERQNQMASRGAAMQIQQLERQGAGQVDLLQRQGDASVQSAEFGRESTLLAGEYGMLAGANQAMQQAQGNQVSAMGMQAQMHGANAQSAGANITNAVVGGATIAAKALMFCIPKGTKIDGIDNKINVEDIKPGDVIVGYNGNPVKVLQKHEYLEDPTKERFYEVEFNNGSVVDVCDMHRIKGKKAIDITENVVSKKAYAGVNYSYDILTEDEGYRINGVPVNSMIEEMAECTVKLKNK